MSGSSESARAAPRRVKRHEVIFTGGSGDDGLDITLDELPKMLTALQSSVRRVVRLAVDGTSDLRGGTWLSDATQIRLTKLEPGSLRATLEVSPLSANAHVADQLRQVPLGLPGVVPLGEVIGEDDCLDLFRAALEDAIKRNTSSPLLDVGVMSALEGCMRAIPPRFTGLRLVTESGARSVEVETGLRAQFEQMRADAPPPRWARYTAKLDMLAHTSKRARLILDNGTSVIARFETMPDDLGALWKEDVLVQGRQHFHLSGKPNTIDVEHIELSASSAPLWRQPPLPQTTPRVQLATAGVDSWDDFGDWSFEDDMSDSEWEQELAVARGKKGSP